MISAPSRRLAVLLGVIAVLTASGGAPVSTPSAADVGDAGRVPVEGGGSYTDITPAQLDATLGEDGFVLVNVHVPYEGEIEGTDAFVPYDQITAHLDRLPADRSAPVVLYCRSGSMSAIAARALVALGYVDVRNLDGGMNAWRSEGFPLIGLPPG